jgi:hypothetical protein
VIAGAGHSVASAAARSCGGQKRRGDSFLSRRIEKSQVAFLALFDDDCDAMQE